MNNTPARLLAGLVLGAATLLAQPSADPQEFRAVDLDAPPKLTKPVAPVYPFPQRAAAIEGMVLIEFIIGADGEVKEAIVVRSNNPAFERPAIDAVLKWRFSPGRKGGRPVNVRVQQTITFNIDGGGRSPWEVQRLGSAAKLPEEYRWHTAPETKHSIFPAYPYDDLAGGRTGKARVRFAIDPTGRVATALVESAATPEMGAAALAAIDGWRFAPARKADGSACWAALAMEFEFARSSANVQVSDSARRILDQVRDGGKRIAELSALDAVPKPLSRRPPIYPTALEREGRPGEAVIEFYIDEKGDAQLPRIVSASAPEFGYAAAQAVNTWRFTPPRKGGKPVVARAQIPVNFGLPKGDR